MRILVLSDSHGCVEPMERCVERVQPQVILHLGDCVRDAQRLEERYPDIPLLGVPGNCDYGGLDQPERLTELGGVRILMMHGHTRRVKSGPMAAIYAARECGADILLFGNNLEYDPAIVAKVQAVIVRAVEDGTISRARLEASWRRILKLKQQMS